MADIVKQPGDCQNPAVMMRKLSFPGVEKGQPGDTDTVVVAVVSVPGLHAIDRSQEADAPEASYRTGFEKPRRSGSRDRGDASTNRPNGGRAATFGNRGSPEPPPKAAANRPLAMLGLISDVLVASNVGSLLTPNEVVEVGHSFPASA